LLFLKDTLNIFQNLCILYFCCLFVFCSWSQRYSNGNCVGENLRF